MGGGITSGSGGPEVAASCGVDFCCQGGGVAASGDIGGGGGFQSSGGAGGGGAASEPVTAWPELPKSGPARLCCSEEDRAGLSMVRIQCPLCLELPNHLGKWLEDMRQITLASFKNSGI